MKQGTRLSVVVLALVLGGTAAPLARASAPSPGEGPAAPGPARGLWMNLKLAMPLSGGYGAAPLPRFLLGYHLGRVAVGLEVGLSGGRSWVTGDDPMYGESRDFQVSLVPTVEVVLARRGRLALTIQTGLGVGYGWSHYQDASWHSSGVRAVLQAAFGARYHLHPRFALGAEVGASAVYSWSRHTYQDARSESQGVQANPWAALTATIIW
jgi:hypothetical protein